MQNKPSVRRIVCSLLLAIAAAAAALFLCRWVGYDLQQKVGDKQTFQIVNDDYSQVIAIPAEGLDQALPLKAGQSIYGVRLKFSTGGEVRKAGMVMVELYNEEGTLLGTGASNFQTIFDGSFVGFTTGSYTAQHDETMTVRIYNAVEWDGTIGLWASADTVQGMPLRAGGKDLHATLALQRMDDYSGTWPSVLATKLQLPFAAAAFAAVLLFGLGAPLPLLVAAVGLCCGLLFVRITPALVAPDEYTHLAASYELASCMTGQSPANADGSLLVRECDVPYFGTRSGEIGIFALKAQELALEQNPGGADVLSAVSEARAGQGSGNYLPQALGIRLARNAGWNFYKMLRAGRICNLAFYLILAVLAVALAPAGVKGVLACVALLPMPLQLAGSLSPDASVLGMVFCYTALCLRLRQKKAVFWEKLLIILLGGAVGPAKAIYLPVVLLCFIIPVENLVGPTATVKGAFGLEVRSGRLIQEAVLVLAGCLWLSANLGELVYVVRDMNGAVLAVGGAALVVLALAVLWLYTKVRGNAARLRWFKGGLAACVVLGIAAFYAVANMTPGLDPDQLLMTNPNGDSIWTFSLGYICRNLPATVKLLLRTIPEQGALWLQGILGTTLGEPIVYRIDVSWLLGIGLLLALLAASLPVQGVPAPLGRRTARGTAGVIFCVVAASLVVMLNWTPINYETLFGMQGRYWLPVLPLALLLLKGGRNVSLQRDVSRPAALVISVCTMLTTLQGFGLYASWQPVS